MRHYHYHRCPACGTHTECINKLCDTEEQRNRELKGEERVCSWCKSLPLLDLRGITREPDRHLTVVHLFRNSHRKKRWITLGQSSLRKLNSHGGPTRWLFESYLDNATDFEHDSAYAIRIGLVAVEFDDVYYGQSTFTGIINTRPDNFHVPTPGYDPRKLAETVPCDEKRCTEVGGPHVIVPEDFYVPPTNQKLFERVAGHYVEIMFGVPVEE